MKTISKIRLIILALTFCAVSACRQTTDPQNSNTGGEGSIGEHNRENAKQASAGDKTATQENNGNGQYGTSDPVVDTTKMKQQKKPISKY
jgi:hypothetical protein